MIKVNIVQVGEIAPNLLSDFKAHARISETNMDALLLGYLREALLKVGEYQDVSLLPCTIEIEASECDGEVRLFQTLDTITSVKSNGNAVAYTLEGNYVKTSAEDVKVVYTTKVLDGNLDAFLPTALAYATARLDGVSGVELYKLLAR